jgi:hypothetical protein
MDEEAYNALDAIGRSADPAHAGRWIKAFADIRWIVHTEAGWTLTSAGRQARDEMAVHMRETRADPRPRDARPHA